MWTAIEARASSKRGAARLVCWAAFVGLVTTLGCGSDDDAKRTPTPTRTPTRPATASPTATATPTQMPEGPELHFGSTAAGGGRLALADDVDYMVQVFFVACIGGTGSECNGGTLLYEASAPGFPAIEEDDPAQPLFRLVDDTEVQLRVTAIEAGASLMFGGVTLDSAGMSTILGTTPELHADGSWHLAVAGGSIPPSRTVSLELTAQTSLYTTSMPFTIRLVPTGVEGE